MQMSEAQLRDAVLDLAKMTGWLHFHVFDTYHPAKRSSTGYPDLHLVRDETSLFVELKSERGRLRADQCEWLAALKRAGHQATVWRPQDWYSGEIERVLL